MGGWAKPTTTHMSIDRQYGWMWAQACELLDQADRMQRGFLRYVGPSADAAVRADAAVWEPPLPLNRRVGGRRPWLFQPPLPLAPASTLRQG